MNAKDKVNEIRNMLGAAMPPEYVELVIKNFDPVRYDALVPPFKDWGQIIYKGFSWSDSPEGYDFWIKIYKTKDSKFPEIPKEEDLFLPFLAEGELFDDYKALFRKSTKEILIAGEIHPLEKVEKMMEAVLNFAKINYKVLASVDFFGHQITYLPNGKTIHVGCQQTSLEKWKAAYEKVKNLS